MKKLISTLFLISIIMGVYLYHEEIVTFLLEKVIYQKEIIMQNNNSYTLGNSYTFVQETNQFTPTSKQDLKNIIYTYLDRGWNNFSFYCNQKVYETCIEDVKVLANDSNLLSNINNFVHPFNSYDKLYITINNLGKVTMSTEKLYNEAEQITLNAFVDQVIKDLIQENMSTIDKIKIIHDYIIEHSVYDEKRANAIKNNVETSVNNPSHKAIGPLINGLSLCSGYSDAMALFLNKLGIQNYKIASENHVWNLVLLDNTWYHLDLTWDDPVVSTHENILLHDFFLISTTELQELDLTQHNFDKNIYIEAK